MLWWFRELCSSLKFLAITGDEPFFQSKRIYEFVLPSISAAVIFFLYWEFPSAFKGSFLKNYSGYVFQFMVFVVPFHLAALAALATYQSETLNKPLAGVNAQLRVWSNQDNGYFYKDLTLRQYVSLLFGYLCSIGVLYVLIYIFASTIDLSVILGELFNVIYCAAILLGMFFVFHYVILTVYAITFLFDKVNQVSSI